MRKPKRQDLSLWFDKQISDMPQSVRDYITWHLDASKWDAMPMVLRQALINDFEETAAEWMLGDGFYGTPERERLELAREKLEKTKSNLQKAQLAAIEKRERAAEKNQGTLAKAIDDLLKNPESVHLRVATQVEKIHGAVPWYKQTTIQRHLSDAKRKLRKEDSR